MNGIAKMMMLRNNTRDDRREDDMPESRRQRDNRGRYMEDDDRPEMRRYDDDYAPEARRRRDSRGRYMEGDDAPEMRGRYDNGNPGMDGRDAPESRFRDRRGREHYDDGRFAPMRSDGRIEWKDYPRDNGPQGLYPRIPPYMPRQEDMPDRPAGLIGFMGREDWEEQSRMRHGREMQNAGHMDRGMADTMEMMDLDQVTAEAWARSLPKEDASGNIVGKGPHWTKEQIKPYMAQAGYTGPEHKFYALMNALYSDFCKLAKKYGHDRPEYYADMAKLWLEDKDAWPEKAGLYYKYIVKH